MLTIERFSYNITKCRKSYLVASSLKFVCHYKRIRGVRFSKRQQPDSRARQLRVLNWEGAAIVLESKKVFVKNPESVNNFENSYNPSEYLKK